MKNILLVSFLVLFCTVSFSQENDTNFNPTDNAKGADSTFKNKLVVYPGFGVGLVRNELSPSFHINIGFNHRNRYEANVNANSFFFFEQNSDSKWNIYRNTFVNAEFLLNFSPLSNSITSWNGVGVGYLVEARGSYFTETAMIFYYKRKYRFFSVIPGLVFDDNFKDVWPVITIKL